LYNGVMDNMDRKSRFHRKAIQVKEAQRLLLERVKPLAAETVPLEASFGRRLADDFVADGPVPHFARSGMDGYAVRHEDAAGASPQQPVALRVAGDVPAGRVWPHALEPGTAVRVMTGAAVPEGATAVVMFEQTEELEQGARVLVKQPPAAGQNIAVVGDEIAGGQRLAVRGTRIGPGQAALLATFGHARVRVVRRPRVAVFATGSELLPVDSPLAPGRIRNSNGPMLAAQIERAGGTPLSFGILPDDAETARTRLGEALAHADLVVTTGGVSVGDYDAMASLFRGGISCSSPANASAGPSAGGGKPSEWLEAGRFFTLFNKVAMRPGSPTSAALAGDKMIVGLSGNPGACFVGFELFVRPLLLRLQGAPQPLPRTFRASLTDGFAKGSPHDRYLRAKLELEDGVVQVRPLGFAKSGMMVTIQDADALAVIPSGSRGAERGELVDVIPLAYGEL
jgi:molybdopterin molybdotransferase